MNECKPLVDGHTFAQSAAMLAYAGAVTGLRPRDPLAALKVGRCTFTLSKPVLTAPMVSPLETILS